MNFKENIQTRITIGELLEDKAQIPMIEALSRVHEALAQQENSEQPGLLNWFKRKNSKAEHRGVYIWGGVGRGKTHLMNIFFEAAPTQFKWRVHFHRFMLWVHEQSGQLADTQDPLAQIARLVSVKNRLLCLDEFMVTDIADAMILHQLLKHLYAQGVTIVTTSNLPPDELYDQGFQRESFLPAIALIKNNSEVVLVDGDRDFRKQTWICDAIYYSPLDQAAREGLSKCHAKLTGLPEPLPKRLMIAGREIEAISVSEDVAWFDFAAICETPRSQKDYIQLSNQFSTLIISDVPALGADDDSAARRLINLIDTAYDYGVNLLVSAAQPPDLIYSGSKLAKPFKRTASRLWEMSTPTYLTRPKKAVSRI